MPDTDLNIVLRLLDEASGKIKSVMNNTGKEADKLREQQNKAANEANKNFLRLTITIGGLIKAYRLVERGIIDVIAVGRAMDSEFNKSFNEFEISVLKVKQSVATQLIPTLQTALDFWAQFLNQNVNTSRGFGADLENAKQKISSLKAELQSLNSGGGIFRSGGGVNTDASIEARKQQIQGLIALENQRIEVLGRLSVAERARVGDKSAENIEILRARQLLDQYNVALKNNEALFIAGKQSSEQYFSFLSSAQSKAIQEAQVRAKTIQEVTALENIANNQSLMSFMSTMELKKQKLQEVIDRMRFVPELMKQIKTSISSNLSAALVNINSFSDAWKSIWQSMAQYLIKEVLDRIMAKLLAIQAVSKAMGFVAKIFSGGILHDGGQVEKFHSGGPIRAHGGLAVDEVPIIAQTGEGVLSRRGMAALGGENMLNRLNRGEASGGSSINITINHPVVRDKVDIRELANLIGIEIEREARYART